jgi:GNAT superfamily N-acetyltransferase
VGKAEDWLIVPLGGTHVRDPFDSGDQHLDTFLKRYASQNEDRGLSRTYVLVTGHEPRVFGYYSISNGSVRSDHFPEEESKRLPKYPTPVVHLGRLAIDRTLQGQGLGSLLLADAVRKAHQVSLISAAYAIEVVAKSDAAKRFYEKHGFKSFSDDPLHLFLNMKVARKLFG